MFIISKFAPLWRSLVLPKLAQSVTLTNSHRLFNLSYRYLLQIFGAINCAWSCLGANFWTVDWALLNLCIYWVFIESANPRLKI